MHLPQGEVGGCFWENGTVCAEAQGPTITVQSGPASAWPS